MGFKTALEDSYLYWILVEKGSYTKAALHLGIPKSQISRRIVELERRLRKVLLFRNTRKIYLTEFGIFYFNSIDSVMREWGNIQDWTSPFFSDRFLSCFFVVQFSIFLWTFIS